jgi:hypothetical protein
MLLFVNREDRRVIDILENVVPALADVPFVCNVCGKGGLFRQAHYSNPELPSCTACGSNVRFRWIVHRLSLQLFNRSIPLATFPSRKSVKGIGLTDPEAIGAPS